MAVQLWVLLVKGRRWYVQQGLCEADGPSPAFMSVTLGFPAAHVLGCREWGHPGKHSLGCRVEAKCVLMLCHPLILLPCPLFLHHCQSFLTPCFDLCFFPLLSQPIPISSPSRHGGCRFLGQHSRKRRWKRVEQQQHEHPAFTQVNTLALVS